MPRAQFPLALKHSYFWWALSLLWSVKIFWFSTGTFRGAATGRVLRSVLAALNIVLSEGTFRLVHQALRKGAHVAEYAVLFLLLYRSIGGSGFLRWKPKTAALAAAVCVAYSLTDELHQVFVRGRGPSLADCALDAAGGLAALVILRTISKHRGRTIES